MQIKRNEIEAALDYWLGSCGKIPLGHDAHYEFYTYPADASDLAGVNVTFKPIETEPNINE
ncbi:hypothetical protein [uncultured Paraglaciecola sp.]|uniref:hypothetical protein n=1 Tax=uncultured Paraglaciecola sp. TaxID=1765024 RepID=UPI002625AD8B|nr:hypothetical protein [uncultured Paraglaciecola sp.]